MAAAPTRLALLVLSWSLPVLAEPVVAVARFACDDKEANPTACDEATWRDAVLKDPTRLEPGKEGDLFVHDDGGPEGAVWNGGAAIFLFVKGGAGAVTLNGVKVSTTKAGEWRWVKVPAAQWQKLSKPRRTFELVSVRVGAQPVGEWWFAHGE